MIVIGFGIVMYVASVNVVVVVIAIVIVNSIVL